MVAVSRKNHHVMPPSSGKWVVTSEGNQHHAVSIHETHAEAVERAREIARGLGRKQELDIHIDLFVQKTDLPKPPLGAEKLLSLFLPLNQQEEKLGDLEEKFPPLVRRHGVRFASVRYWCEALKIALVYGLKLAGVVTAIWKAFSALR